jgi:hypothetical protein
MPRAPARRHVILTKARIQKSPAMRGFSFARHAELSDSQRPGNWRTSIVELMKLLDLDSSLHARKSLADELHYTGTRTTRPA